MILKIALTYSRQKPAEPESGYWEGEWEDVHTMDYLSVHSAQKAAAADHPQYEAQCCEIRVSYRMTPSTPWQTDRRLVAAVQSDGTLECWITHKNKTIQGDQYVS